MRPCQGLDPSSILGIRSRSFMKDTLEDDITHAILQILLEARKQGKELLSYDEVLTLLGFNDQSLSEQNDTVYFTLNKDMLDQLDDPEIVKAMIESMGATKH